MQILTTHQDCGFLTLKSLCTSSTDFSTFITRPCWGSHVLCSLLTCWQGFPKSCISQMTSDVSHWPESPRCHEEERVGSTASAEGLCALYLHKRQSQAQNLTSSSFHLFLHLGDSVLSRHCWFLAVGHSPPIFQCTQIGQFTLPVLSRSECDHAGNASGGRGFGSWLCHSVLSVYQYHTPLCLSCFGP